MSFYLNTPSPRVKSEPGDPSSGMSDSEKAIQDPTCLRLSLVEDQTNFKQIVDLSIYYDSMRDFLAKVKRTAASLSQEEELELLFLAVTCIDLTTLSGDDTTTNVERLCHRAIHALDEDLTPGFKDVSCAAVCVYPARVLDCRLTLKRLKSSSNVQIAAVATGFPSGQYGIKTRVEEIKEAVTSGADEIDVVINRAAALADNWPLVFEELCEMRKACDIRKTVDEHEVHMKVIIGAGDLLNSSLNTIYVASLVAILAGADFIKTSTGKESVNATLPIGFIMMRAIIQYYDITKIKVGFKPAGGIRTYKDALQWLVLVKMLLGPEWMTNELFRFGASGLLDDVEKRIRQLTKVKKPEQ